MAAEQKSFPEDVLDPALVGNDAEMEDTKAESPPARKRKRSLKLNVDKKFECKHEGCGKSYSRAEHLYRHQLNHTPKTIYRCDYPDCNRYFVRQDLCVRHRERHTTHGSQLHKRDTFAQSSSDQSTNGIHISVDQNGPDSRSHHDMTAGSLSPLESKPHLHSQNLSETFASPDLVHRNRVSGSTPSYSTASSDPRFQPHTPQTVAAYTEATWNRPSSTTSTPMSPIQKQPPTSWIASDRRESFGARDVYAQPAAIHASMQRPNNHSGMGRSPSRSYSMSSTSTNHMGSHTQSAYHQTTSYDPSTDHPMHSDSHSKPYESPSYGFHSSTHSSNAIFAAAVSQGLNAIGNDSYVSYPNMSNAMSGIEFTAPYGYPVFGGDDLSRSTFSMGDDFASWLFNDYQPGVSGFSSTVFLPGFTESPTAQVQGPYFNNETSSSTNRSLTLSMQNPMSMNSILGASKNSNYIMSDEKRQELLHLMEAQFIERPHDAVKKRKDSVFEGNINDDDHILSLRMMHTYIASYWYHQHAQLPILHKPTFSADKTPNLLLLAVLAIGAATLDKAYGTSLTDSAAEFANFVAWHIRWEIMRDADFRPPAKLWVFQTLLLIEVYEKMYATRALHERAHIHHDTTLTLMRRGSSLLGRSASDSPPSGKNDQGGKSGSHPGSASETTKSEDSWTRWIATEATRRCAFGAFLLDSLHATMFGHAAKMVAHEMRLPLPCDEGLWSAVSPAEAGRVQSSLQTNGIRPIMFLEALKKTLNGERVRTNSFGRTIIMAGLLSVSWHMTQRDLQINSLGARTVQTFGGPDKWKGALLRAFDNWKRDFDEALAESAALRPNSPPNPRPEDVSRTDSEAPMLRPVDEENIFESRTVLHHLAHIAAHVDAVDCQVFAGANRLLGRTITPKDYSNIREKITERWATRASARDAAFYALKFIAQVLVPGDYDGKGWRYGHASPILPQAFDERDMYIARDDFLLNRPWVLYISTLVVFCYGFALEGPLQPPPRDEDFDTYEKKDKDMRKFLERVAGVRAPDDLEHVTGKNRCLGMLMLLQESFAQSRWELTREAGGLLGNCVMKLMGKTEGQEERMAGG